MAQVKDGQMAQDAEKNLVMDEAIAMVGEQPQDVDPVVLARAVTKTDWYLIPAMVFGCESPRGAP